MTAQQLKNSILQMAVQGKLTPQDPDDEPASVLLERIRAEKEKLVKEGKIKKEKTPSIIFRGDDNLPYEKIGRNEPVCIADEVPFEIPDSWEWVRLSDAVIKEIKRGKSPQYTDKSSVLVFAQKCNVKTGGIDIGLAKYLDIASFSKYSEDEYMLDEDIVVNSTGNGTLGRVGIFKDGDRINDNIIVPDSHITIIRISKEISREYALCVLEYYQPYLEKSGEGSTNQTELRPSILANLFFPLPPLREQIRIVSSITGLKEYTKRYDQKEQALIKLNTEFPELLKKSILQQAVMGKLVLQDSNEEPAFMLLDRIRAEKQKLIKEGKIKKDKYESVIFRRDNSHYERIDGIERCIDDEIPFEIPSNWNWTTIGTIFNLQAGKNIKSSEIYDTPTEKSYLCYGGNGIRGYTDFYNYDGDYPIIGRQGALCGCINRATGLFYATEHAVCVDTFAETDVSWACYFLTALNLNQYATATAQPGLAVSKINQVLIPVPPLAEQQRIVAKIEELMLIIKAL